MNENNTFPDIYPYLKPRTQKIVDVVGILFLPVSIISFLYLIELRGSVSPYVLSVLAIVCIVLFFIGLGVLLSKLDEIKPKNPGGVV